jgi:nickel-dependent lactate racemase
MATPELFTTLTPDQIRQWIASRIPVEDFRGRRVLLIVPDNTRTAPLPVLFPALRQHLRPHVTALDVLVALGTHRPMPDAAIRSMLGIAAEDPCGDVGLFNHAWDNPAELVQIGMLTKAETEELSSAHV